MVSIDINEVKKILERILDNKITREEASAWALKLREFSDNNNLQFIPNDFEPLVWESILFIEGIDLRDDPNSYLHNEQDIQIFLQKLK